MIHNIVTLFFLKLSFEHFSEEEVSFVFQQVKNNVFSVSFAKSLVQISMLTVFVFAAWTKTKRLVFYLFLLVSCQEEPLVGCLSNPVDQTDSMEDVVAVQESNIFVSNEDAFVTKFALLPHGFRLFRVEFVLKKRHRLGLRTLRIAWLLFSLYQEDYKFFIFKIKSILVL